MSRISSCHTCTPEGVRCKCCEEHREIESNGVTRQSSRLMWVLLRRSAPRSDMLLSFFVSFCFVIFLAACTAAPKRVVILSDGQRRVVETNAVTVQDVLIEQNIPLGGDDRADPPPFAEIARSSMITITRVSIQTDVVNRTISFTRQLIRDETYPQNQMRVVRLGANGSVVVTYTVTIENGIETARRETGRTIVTQPQDEILAVGTQGSLVSVPITGTLAYIANGNAWVMRHSSNERRPLTSAGDLDGRVFSLSPDGRYLLFSRAADDKSNNLNSLWMINTFVLDETPRALDVKDVLYAQLAPDVKSVVYSTGEKTGGAPGWRAHNDLIIASLNISDTVLLKSSQTIWNPSVPAPYSWWGTNFSLAPDGRAIAYAFSNEIGFADATARATDQNPTPRRLLKSFAPFRSRSDWAWIPQVGWSPDSRYILGVVHAPLSNPSVASDDPTFEVWGLARDGSVNAALAKQTGMWSAPMWSPPNARGESQIAFGISLFPSDSERSRYTLNLMDRDGGNKKQILPLTNENGLLIVQLAWSPDARQLIAVRDGDLWLFDGTTGRWSQLTANAASSLPRWAK